MPQKSDQLRKSNREVLVKHFPSLLSHLEQFHDPISKPVVVDGRVVNIDLGGTLLYPKDAETTARSQLDAYFENPDRVGFPDPGHCNLSPVSHELLAKIQSYMRDDYGREIQSYPVVNVGFCMVFGIGLGTHLKELIQRSGVKCIVLVEPVVEMLIHSMDAIDWGEILDAAKENDAQLFFLMGLSPTEAVAQILSLVWNVGQTFLDGSYAYVHYPSWTLLESRKLLNEKIRDYYLSRGFFEDEVLMMTNAYGNFTRHDFKMLGRGRYLEQQMPVFIVGAGPSLDQGMSKIKEYRSRAILVSCGCSSLGILLQNGLTPDFHLEIENSRPLVDNLRRLASQYDLSSVVFIGSTTVDPDVGELFSRKWLFYRSQLSPTFVLNPDVTALVGAEPLVANASFSTMLSVGFKKFYMIGVDCGRRREHGHHAKQAMYYDEEYDNYLEGESFERLENEFNQVVPANFGGEALTTGFLDLSRNMLASVLALSNVEMFNCSDGARIDGARPLAPSSLVLDGPEGGQKKAIQTIENQLPSFKKGEVLTAVDLKKAADSCDEFLESLPEIADKIRQEDGDFIMLEEEMRALRRKGGEKTPAIFAIGQGSIGSMVRLGAFAGTRIAEEKARRDYMRFFLDEYVKSCQWVAKETKRMLLAMADGETDLGDIGVRPK